VLDSETFGETEGIALWLRLGRRTRAAASLETLVEKGCELMQEDDC
jgi:hypothetical protein